MIIVKLFHGLGNQMFQYAFSVGFQLKGIEVKYDLSFFDEYEVHNGFELSHVFEDIKIPLVTGRDVLHFLESKIVDGQRKFSLLPDKKIVREAKEDEFSYDNSLQHLDDTFFSGYWQNESYFNPYKPEIQKAFTFKSIDNHDKRNIKLLNHIQATNSVSIHIRGGDYLGKPSFINLKAEYYTRAINQIKQLESEPVFFVFSDDTSWAKSLIKEKNVVFVTHNKGANSYLDMQLMSMCKHNITANSTFSWWAAWLNKNTNKIVIIPSKWFTTPVDVSGLLLPSYIHMEV